MNSIYFSNFILASLLNKYYPANRFWFPEPQKCPNGNQKLMLGERSVFAGAFL